MQNQNDATAEYYEIANQYLKNNQVLSEELALVSSLCDKEQRILDIGCGTGRHLIPLHQSGYEVYGIDSSKGMLAEIIKQQPDARLVNKDFLTYKYPKQSVDLCLMFWNTFNEIALDEATAKAVLNKCHEILRNNGKVLINIDDAESLDVANLDFQFKIDNPVEFTYDWKVVSYDKPSNTTTSQESIILPEKTISTKITQHWWHIQQLTFMASDAGFTIEIAHIKSNAELYIILTKVGE